MRAILTFFLLLFTGSFAGAQAITGVIADAAGGAAIGDVVVQNIHTDAVITTDAKGSFTIAAKPGQLVEFRKLGYKTARLRVVSSTVPFYRIILEPGVLELDEVSVRNQFRDFRHDSIRYHEYFKKQLEYPVLTGWRAIQSPFTAMGKTNQQMISFQREYEWFERQKFVDYHFNEKLIANLTGLQGDSLQRYMSQYRPSYEMIRSMHEYDYFAYVKRTVSIWRKRQRLGPTRSRGGG
jgi:hypothetical protein